MLGLLRTLSELAADLKLCVDPLLSSLWSPPHLWVHCQLSDWSLPWINTVQILSELAADPIWLGCWSTPSPIWVGCWSTNPPRINTVWILSELAVDPIWVGCWLTPYPQDQHCGNTLWVGCRPYLGWLLINPHPQDQHCKSSLSWLQCLSILSKSSWILPNPCKVTSQVDCWLSPQGSTLLEVMFAKLWSDFPSWLLIDPRDQHSQR